jgi:hypothetical protein
LLYARARQKAYLMQETSAKVVRGVFVGRRMSGNMVNCCESEFERTKAVYSEWLLLFENGFGHSLQLQDE